jgi:beta-glucosidase
MEGSVEGLKQMGAMFAESMGESGLAELFEAVLAMKKYDGIRSLSGLMGGGTTEARLTEIIDELNAKLGLE